MNAIETLDYDTLLSEMIDYIKANVPSYTPLESDNYMPIIEAMAYREELLRARVNNVYKSMLLPYATGDDLDAIVVMYGITRLQGSYPTAEVELSLSTPQSYDITIPEGLRLSSDNGDIALITATCTISAGNTTITTTAELQQNMATSDVKCETIQTPLPYVAKVSQLTDFMDGGDIEADDQLRERAILSLSTFSTAGSADSYSYHTRLADSRVKDVAIFSFQPGEVSIYVQTTDGDNDDSIITNITEQLNRDDVRPLTDSIKVYFATPVTVDIVADVYLSDLLIQNDVYTEIINSIPIFAIGDELPISSIYALLSCSGKYKVEIQQPTASTTIEANEYITIGNLDISFKGA